MVRILDRMEADGLLERRADPADRRARRLYLTAKAKPLLDEIWRLAELTRAEISPASARAEREAFMACSSACTQPGGARRRAGAEHAHCQESRAARPTRTTRGRRLATKQET